MVLTQDHVFLGVQVEIAHLVRNLIEILANYLVHNLLFTESLDSKLVIRFRCCLVEHIRAHCARLVHERQTTHDRIESLRNDTLLKMGDRALKDVSDELLQVLD
jgi:hypothetical protein